MSWFVTATDTGVGKTYVTALIVRTLRQAGVDAVPFKPVCSGDDADREILFAACEGVVARDVINPVWLREPLAPMLAARREGRRIELDALVEAYEALHAEHACVVVEGAGGWLAPVGEGFSVADLAMRLRLPVVVVAPNRLGVINHWRLTLSDMRQRGVVHAFTILNSLPVPPDASQAGNLELMRELAVGEERIYFLDRGVNRLPEDLEHEVVTSFSQ